MPAARGRGRLSRPQCTSIESSSDERFTPRAAIEGRPRHRGTGQGSRAGDAPRAAAEGAEEGRTAAEAHGRRAGAGRESRARQGARAPEGREGRGEGARSADPPNRRSASRPAERRRRAVLLPGRHTYQTGLRQRRAARAARRRGARDRALRQELRARSGPGRGEDPRARPERGRRSRGRDELVGRRGRRVQGLRGPRRPEVVSGALCPGPPRRRRLPGFWPNAPGIIIMLGTCLPGGVEMKFRSAAIGVLAAAVPFSAPVFAHHSQAMFDATQEILIEGTVHRYDWKNPHIYLIVDTIGPDGKRALIEGEGLAITQALVDGLRPDAFEPGMRVVMRANPNRGGWGKQVRILDVTTEDGEIHPFYAANKRTLELKPAESIASKWAPSRQAVYAAFSAMANWPLKAEALAIKEQAPIDGLCYVEPVPFLAILDEMRSIEVHDDRVLLHFDNSGDHVDRTVYLNAEHPADLEPSLHGHSVGWWEGDTLV